MNRNCHGDFFTADGARYYRCLADSTLVLSAANGESCPSCGREVCASDRGVVPVSTITQRIAVLPDGVKVILSSQQT